MVIAQLPFGPLGKPMEPSAIRPITYAHYHIFEAWPVFITRYLMVIFGVVNENIQYSFLR